MAVSPVDAALRMAIEKEQQSWAFYVRWADRVKDPGAAALLSELAAEEVRHKRRLEEGLPLARAAEPDGPAPADLGLTETLVEDEPTAEATTQDVLIVAMHREERAERLYASLAEWVRDDRLRRILHGLTGEERQHRVRLEALYDDLVLNQD